MAQVPSWFALCFAFGAWGCSENYCQSGPKYGTQCYSINEVEWQRSMVGEPLPRESSTQPSPGCALVNQSGVYMVPQNPTSSVGPRATATLPPAYLMSGACVSRQQPVVGAR